MATGDPNLDAVMEQQLLKATEIIEQQVDAQLKELNKIDDEDELEKLKQKRLIQLKKAQQQKQEWIQIGHGRYEEIAGEPEFFDACKKSKHVVCHFYRDSTLYCKVVDKHLAELAPKHIETRFIKINAEKCPFLVERLRIKVMPTICLARDGKTVDYIVGFDDLGGTPEFKTEMLEWRLARADIINYSGDLMNPPVSDANKKKSVFGAAPKKIIRGRDDDNSDSDD